MQPAESKWDETWDNTPAAPRSQPGHGNSTGVVHHSASLGALEEARWPQPPRHATTPSTSMTLRDRGGFASSPWGPVDPRSQSKFDAFLRGPIAAEVSYCLVSAGTILFNKHALSTFEFPAPNVLLTFQFGIAVVLLKVLHLLGFLHLEPMRWDIVKLWFPVNIIFVLMNATGASGKGVRPSGGGCRVLPHTIL